MKRLVMSKAAAGLLRGFLARAGAERDRILLIHLRSTDWQSLTFVGERHELQLAIIGHGARSLFDRVVTGLSDEQFAISGQIVADIALEGAPVERADGSLSFSIGALTIAE